VYVDLDVPNLLSMNEDSGVFLMSNHTFLLRKQSIASSEVFVVNSGMFSLISSKEMGITFFITLEAT
jgi:hypothetical protein